MVAAARSFALVISALAVACRPSDRHLESESERLCRQGGEDELVRARQELQTLVDARRSSADRAGLAHALEALARVTDALGDRKEALPIFESALTLERELGAGARASRIESGMAVILLESDNRAGARHLADQALADAAAASDPVARGQALYALANLDQERDLLDRSRSEYHEALTLFRANGEESWAGRALHDLGDVADREGQGDEARRYYNESLATFERIGDRRGQALALHALSRWSLVFRNDLAAGLRYSEQAAALDRRAGNAYSLAFDLDSIGMFLVRLGQPDRAIGLHREALALRRRVHSRRGEAQTQWSLGDALGAAGRFDEAGAAERAATTTFHEIGDQTFEAEALLSLAEVERRGGRLSEAEAIVDQALASRESLRNRVALTTRRAYYTESIRFFYDLAVAVRMQRAAEQHDAQQLQSALLLSERARGRSMLDTLALANVGPGSDPEARRQDEIQREVERLDDELEAAPNDAASLERRSRLVKAIDARLAEYAALQQQRERQRPDLRALNRIEPPAVAVIQSALDADTVLLEYYVGSSGCFVWAISHDDLIGVKLADQAELERAAQSFYEHLTTRARPSAHAGLAAADAAVEREALALSQSLIHPIAGALNGKRRLVVIPDGMLRYIPFGLLLDELGTPLANDRELYYTPSFTVLSALRARRRDAELATSGLVVFADPVFSPGDARTRTTATATNEPAHANVGAAAVDEADSGAPQADLTRALADVGASYLARLPHTQEEAASIASLLPRGLTSLRLGFAAQKQTILSGALRHYRWVHLATHGLVDSTHPERSGLVFSRFDEQGRPRDGYLRLREIYDLSLSADLIVLSACQTALGRQVRRDGLVSVTRGFLHAGARRVLATLWPVEDRATARLMKEFYRALLVDGSTPGLALARAKRALRADPQFHAPFYWAGFVLHGDWQSEPMHQRR